MKTTQLHNGFTDYEDYYYYLNESEYIPEYTAKTIQIIVSYKRKQLTGKLTTVINNLTKMLAAVPLEYQTKAVFNDDYEDNDARDPISIRYTRPKTPTEIAFDKRIEDEEGANKEIYAAGTLRSELTKLYRRNTNLFGQIVAEIMNPPNTTPKKKG